MAYRSNNINYNLASYGLGLSGTVSFNRQKSISIQVATRLGMSKTSSAPQGYRVNNSVLFPIANGGISGRAKMETTPTANLIGIGYWSGDCLMIVTTTAIGDLLASFIGSTTLTFATFCDIMGFGYFVGNADISAQPTARDIAGEFFATAIDGSYNMRDLMRLFASVLAGKTTITDLGGGNANVIFRDLNDTLNRVDVDMTGSERTNITLDL